jgi:N-acetyltransferase 10
MLDYHVILDLLPTVALLYFQKRLGDDVRLSAVQSSILLALGLQRKSIEEVEVSFYCRLWVAMILTPFYSRLSSNYLSPNHSRCSLRSSVR